MAKGIYFDRRRRGVPLKDNVDTLALQLAESERVRGSHLLGLQGCNPAQRGTAHSLPRATVTNKSGGKKGLGREPVTTNIGKGKGAEAPYGYKTGTRPGGQPLTGGGYGRLRPVPEDQSNQEEVIILNAATGEVRR